MTDAEFLQIYKEAYCTKEASFVAGAQAAVRWVPQLFTKIGPHLKKFSNFATKKDLLSAPKRWIDDALAWGRRGFKKAPKAPGAASSPSAAAPASSALVPASSAAGTQTASNTAAKSGIVGRSWDFIKRHPYASGAVGTVGLGGGATYLGSKYVQAKKEAHPLYGISQFISQNPKMALILLGGALSAPLWLPPVIGAMTGRRGGGQGYQMGYYPGR